MVASVKRGTLRTIHATTPILAVGRRSLMLRGFDAHLSFTENAGEVVQESTAELIGKLDFAIQKLQIQRKYQQKFFDLHLQRAPQQLRDGYEHCHAEAIFCNVRFDQVVAYPPTNLYESCQSFNSELLVSDRFENQVPVQPTASYRPSRNRYAYANMATVTNLPDEPEQDTPRAGTAGTNQDPGDSVFDDFPSLIGDPDNAVPFVSTDGASASTITAAHADTTTVPQPIPLPTPARNLNASFNPMNLSAERSEEIRLMHDVSKGSSPDEAFLPDSVSSTTLFNWLQTKDPAAYKQFLSDMKTVHHSTIPSPPKPAMNHVSTPAPADISSALEPLLQTRNY